MSWVRDVATRLSSRRSDGQILMIYAVAAAAIVGFAGLAVDGGCMFTQRRLTQNGADAAALVAARDIVKGTYGSIDSHVTTYARNNAGSTATVSWNYVDNAGATVSQSNATGVNVVVNSTFNTWFVRAVGVSNFTVSGRAKAMVQELGGVKDTPFIVCANTLQYVNSNNPPPYAGGILDYSTTPPSIIEAAIGQQFFIHGSQLGQNGGDCGWTGGSANFKGNADVG